MSNRHLARTMVMQSLYQWDFLGQPKEQMASIVAFNRHEFAPDFDDGGYIEETLRSVLENQVHIDNLIIQFAPDWPLDTMAIVDRNVLRLGTYELIYVESMPSKVAINEAIELAKTFGGEASGRFVNGVLGAIYKNQVAEGKLKPIDNEPPKKEKIETPSV